MTGREVVKLMESRFTSGNDVPVERAYIRRDEWDALMAQIKLDAAGAEVDAISRQFWKREAEFLRMQLERRA